MVVVLQAAALRLTPVHCTLRQRQLAPVISKDWVWHLHSLRQFVIITTMVIVVVVVVLS